ncbi:MAG: hypothetical protein NZ850_01570 [Caldimicrobium sp.]|nr:hypothetical protein [Caldimicrobium sp.]
MRVLQIEGKLLHLELGGHKFQARITGSLNPEDFKIGEFIKVRVAKSEGPVVLEVLEVPQGKHEASFLYLLVKRGEAINIKAAQKKQEFNFIIGLLKLLSEKKEVRDKDSSKRGLEDLLGKEIKISEFILEEDRLFLPFVFRDDKSWGYIEILTPEEKAGKIKVLLLKLFLEYLGLVEASFWYQDNHIEIELFFSEREALEFAKGHLADLKADLSFFTKFVKIMLEKRDVIPGQILSKIG